MVSTYDLETAADEIRNRWSSHRLAAHRRIRSWRGDSVAAGILPLAGTAGGVACQVDRTGPESSGGVRTM
jgi:hypothetical protein